MNTADMQIIVLAPGTGARSGSPEPSATSQAGARLQLMLGRASAIAGHAVTAVLGARAAELAPALGKLPVSLVVNRDWTEGQAAAIRAGVLSLPGSCAAALLLRADQAAVSSADLQRLADHWRRSPRAVVAAQYGGGHGLPAIFPRSEFAALLRLRGEQGADALLRSPATGLVGVPMPSAALQEPVELARPTDSSAE